MPMQDLGAILLDRLTGESDAGLGVARGVLEDYLDGPAGDGARLVRRVVETDFPTALHLRAVDGQQPGIIGQQADGQRLSGSHRGDGSGGSRGSGGSSRSGCLRRSRSGCRSGRRRGGSLRRGRRGGYRRSGRRRGGSLRRGGSRGGGLRRTATCRQHGGDDEQQAQDEHVRTERVVLHIQFSSTQDWERKPLALRDGTFAGPIRSVHLLSGERYQTPGQRPGQQAVGRSRLLP